MPAAIPAALYRVSPVVLGPVVDDEQRQRLGGGGGRPDDDGDGVVQTDSADVDLLATGRDAGGVQPPRRPVAAELDDRVRAERRVDRPRVVRVAHELGALVPAQLEQVLEPVDGRPRYPRRPPVRRAGEPGGTAAESDVLRQPHPTQLVSGVGDVEDHLVAAHRRYGRRRAPHRGNLSPSRPIGGPYASARSCATRS
ncbi:MAG: hypothetical protein J2P24_09410 [Streptosporangiales bacterium]|nr:hypothetical protein [Streptosporangiales bacterium]